MSIVGIYQNHYMYWAGHYWPILYSLFNRLRKYIYAPMHVSKTAYCVYVHVSKIECTCTCKCNGAQSHDLKCLIQLNLSNIPANCRPPEPAGQ